MTDHAIQEALREYPSHVFDEDEIEDMSKVILNPAWADGEALIECATELDRAIVRLGFAEFVQVYDTTRGLTFPDT